MRPKKRKTLRTLLQSHPDSYWWIDVLCARTDTPLAIMGDIYACCKQCYAMIDCRPDIITSILSMKHRSEESDPASWSIYEHNVAVNTLETFTSSNWWRRVWTWQEAVLPKAVILMAETLPDDVDDNNSMLSIGDLITLYDKILLSSCYYRGTFWNGKRCGCTLMLMINYVIVTHRHCLWAETFTKPNLLYNWRNPRFSGSQPSSSDWISGHVQIICIISKEMYGSPWLRVRRARLVPVWHFKKIKSQWSMASFHLRAWKLLGGSFPYQNRKRLPKRNSLQASKQLSSMPLQPHECKRYARCLWMSRWRIHLSRRLKNPYCSIIFFFFKNAIFFFVHHGMYREMKSLSERCLDQNIVFVIGFVCPNPFCHTWTTLLCRNSMELSPSWIHSVCLCNDFNYQWQATM